MRKAVIFDGDDTLWQTQVLYDRARAGFVDFLARRGIDSEQVVLRSRDISAALVNRINPDTGIRYGFSAARFPASFVETLCSFLPDASGRDIARARLFGQSVFVWKAKPVKGAGACLKALKEAGYDLILLTKGEEAVQKKRIADFPHSRFFDHVVIVPEKNSQTFESLTAQFGFDRNLSFSVGDSIRADITPADAAGIKTILLQSANWAYERQGDIPPATLIAPDLNAIRRFILDTHPAPKEKAMTEDDLKNIESRLQKSWCRATGSDENWTPENPALGQCAVTACVVQDELGGDILWSPVSVPGMAEPVSHYFNKIGGETVDLTRSQFPEGAVIPEGQPKTKGYPDTRSYILSFPKTAERYELLSARMK